MYHGVERRATVGVYRTFWALLDLDAASFALRTINLCSRRTRS
jgi:predicted GH43/DUF377 family glycosyl hydrolase